MSDFPDDLLRAALRLHGRRKGQKGPLRAAYVRRSISTTYYALFHFISEETTARMVGAGNDLRKRRRIVSRTLTHAGITLTFGKLKSPTIDPSVADLFRLPTTPSGPIVTPDFVRRMATAYLDAKAKREDADYDLNIPLSETDARQLRRRVMRAINDWTTAKMPADRDVKHATAILLLLKGRLRE